MPPRNKPAAARGRAAPPAAGAAAAADAKADEKGPGRGDRRRQNAAPDAAQAAAKADEEKRDKAVRVWSRRTKPDLHKACTEHKVAFKRFDTKVKLDSLLVAKDHFPPAEPAAEADDPKGSDDESGSEAEREEAEVEVADASVDSESDSVPLVDALNLAALTDKLEGISSQPAEKIGGDVRKRKGQELTAHAAKKLKPGPQPKAKTPAPSRPNPASSSASHPAAQTHPDSAAAPALALSTPVAPGPFIAIAAEHGCSVEMAVQLFSPNSTMTPQLKSEIMAKLATAYRKSGALCERDGAGAGKLWHQRAGAKVPFTQTVHCVIPRQTYEGGTRRSVCRFAALSLARRSFIQAFRRKHHRCRQRSDTHAYPCALACFDVCLQPERH
jgi:hypothetical protein